MVIWLIGLSGAGKTTVGRAICRLWRQTAPNTVLVDGDEIRRMFAMDQLPGDYSMAARRANAERMAGICAWLDAQDMNVVCCILSMFPDQRAENRTRFKAYYEVFLDAPMELLEQRDPKGIYAEARQGRQHNVAGCDLPFPRPEHPDLIIDMADAPPPDELAARILSNVAHSS
jgi:cytidine diphosphoramidate kinase